VDAGAFEIYVRGATGTRIEITEERIAEVEKAIRDTIGEDLQLIISELGVTADWSAAYTPNSGPMDAVVKVSQGIADLTGPSCCKAYVRSALSAAVAIFAERFGIVLPVARASAVCRDSDRHPHGCREEKCPYYQKPSRDIFTDPANTKDTICRS